MGARQAAATSGTANDPESALARVLGSLPAGLRELNASLAANPVNLAVIARPVLADARLHKLIDRVTPRASLALNATPRLEEAAILLGPDVLRLFLFQEGLLEAAPAILTAGPRLSERARRQAEQQIVILRRHLLATAVLSRRAAELLQCQDPERAYLAGSVHDIGIIALLTIDAGYEMAPPRALSSVPLAAEQDLYGADHCELGARMAGAWEFPPDIIDAILHHHQPERASEDETLVAAVAAASRFSLSRLGGQPARAGILGDERLAVALEHEWLEAGCGV